MSVRDKWVRRFSVDETAKHKNGFTIYKITSVLFPLESPEAVTVVSVWKRYSDVQRLRRSLRALHTGLHLRGSCPALATTSYFKRFNPEVIEERAKSIKALLEFVAEHRLLFTSTDFVNFLQSGYPEPEREGAGVIAAIRSALRLPAERTPPLEYQSDDDAQSPQSPHRTAHPLPAIDTVDVSQIPIYEAADVEIRESPKAEQLSNSDSFESLNSLESLGSDLFDELNKVTIDSKKPLVKRNVLPDLINFDAPSTSEFEDYHTMPSIDDAASLSSVNEPSSVYEDSRINSSRVSLQSKNSVLSLTDTVNKTRTEDSYASETSSVYEDRRRSSSRVSVISKRSALSLSDACSRTRTEDSYVFEAGYALSAAARYASACEYRRAFECYKTGIETMLLGVQTDTDARRRALVREKTNKYLACAEDIYRNHLCHDDNTLLLERESTTSRAHYGIPLSMLQRPYAELERYRVLAVLGSSVMLVLHEGDHTCYAMKVIQKIPNNLTEFDSYFQQRSNETRQPTLPTVIPYMVPLHAYIETNNLFFLILAYAPGEKLFDYIKNYAKSIPNTPAREPNLENVFVEPTKNRNDTESIDETDANVNIETKIASKFNDKDDSKIKIDVLDNVDKTSSGKYKIDSSNTVQVDSRIKIDDLADINKNVGKTDSLDSMEVSELVLNSQKLLMNVDKALTDVPKICRMEEDSDMNTVEEEQREAIVDKKEVERVETLSYAKQSHFHPRDALPPSAVCLWGAQLLTALESLHNAGVICRDLNPSNILLGERGQIILTYFLSYPGRQVFLSRSHARTPARAYVAPELRDRVCVEHVDDKLDRVCDFWSYGAIMYELVCGYPLSAAHPVVWSHTAVRLPDGVPLEARSLLAQLLTYEPSERLGSGAGGVSDIKQHPYFRHIDWAAVGDDWLAPG